MLWEEDSEIEEEFGEFEWKVKQEKQRNPQDGENWEFDSRCT